MAQPTPDCTHLKSLPFSRLLYYVIAEPAALRPPKPEPAPLRAPLFAAFA